MSEVKVPSFLEQLNIDRTVEVEDRYKALDTPMPLDGEIEEENIKPSCTIKSLSLIQCGDSSLAEATQEIIQPILHTEMLVELLKKILPIDFKKEASISEDEKLTNGQFLIITIEEILRLAKCNSWGMCRNNGFFYLFNGAYWSLIDIDELKTFLGSAAEMMGVNQFKAKHYNFREQLFKQFITLSNLPKPEQFKDTIFVNLQNGTLTITPKEAIIQPFNRDDFITYQLPFEHNPTATAPMFEQYLNKVLPDINKQKILMEYLGYIFINSSTLKLEKALLLYGTGANGKSVFYEVVRSLLGEQNTSEYSLQSLTNDNGYYRAMIANKLVNYASEISGKLEASIFKQLVSGEPVEARLPYSNPFILTKYAKLIFNCNELPKDVEQTEAYFRRLIIITFDVTIPETEQDKQLAQKIISSELPGVLNLVLSGLYRLLEQKQFTYCEAVQQARKLYEIESNSVKLFIQEFGYKPHPTSCKLIKDLYLEYRTFCTEDGYKPVSKLNFKKRLISFNIIVERKNIGEVACICMSV